MADDRSVATMAVARGSAAEIDLSRAEHPIPVRSTGVGLPLLIAYSAPAFGAGYLVILVNTYMMKFSTDVLLIAPGIMGLIFGISRIWDAVCDPLVGFYSDRTALAMGRRRTWILASALPISATFVMMFSPPDLSAGWLTVWMAVSIVGFCSAMSLFAVPHMSLGAELSLGYHERNRVFGYRHAFYAAGSILSLGAMFVLIGAKEVGGTPLIRQRAFELAIVAAMVMVGLILWVVARVRERPDFVGRVSPKFLLAFAGVLKNPHGRLLLIVTFIQHLGGSAIATMALYMTDYVVGAPTYGPVLILAYMIPAFVSVPVWLSLSARFGKINVWAGSMVVTAIAFAASFMAVFLTEMEYRLWLIMGTACVTGFMSAAGSTFAPSLQADVIDYDEFATGERKEGSYYAAWNFVYNGAFGVMLISTGFVLQLAGFTPNVEQTQTSKLMIAALFSLVPTVCFLLGAYLISRFKLDERECITIRQSLDAQSAVHK